jgi:indolepyruvate ferredoxin oxidoreductase beta subunit
MRPRMNIYLAGVGGQGIGLLSEVLTRACLEAGYHTIGCDTLGIAQRGGAVTSHLRIGDPPLFGPLIPAGGAELVVALERLEAERAVRNMLRPGGHVFFCDAVHQPIAVRTGDAPYPPLDTLEHLVDRLKGHLHRVPADTAANPRLQNTALLARLVTDGAIEGLLAHHVVDTMKKAIPSAVFEQNRTAFEALLGVA